MNNHVQYAGQPEKQGLYDPSFEKDSCGIGFVANIKGIKSHTVVRQGLQALENLVHRGAAGCDPCTGDGAGILVQIPHRFLIDAAKSAAISLPDVGNYAVGMVFLPPDLDQRIRFEKLFENIAKEEGLQTLGWRDVPVKSEYAGSEARKTEPKIRQIFVDRGSHEELAFERLLYVVRKRVENTVRNSVDADLHDGRKFFYIVSLSSRTIVYKGLLLPEQVTQYYPDLSDSKFDSAIALVHSRFSTNTFPTWPLAHPFRMICHNGEINTVKGNVNWMRARQGRLQSDVFGKDISKLFPIVPEGQSDSACLDNALEFLLLGGRSLPHAMMMLIPEPWVANPSMDLERRGFYQYHSAMMEPWDGPAAVCFTDGKMIGATLDRNGLRPCRYLVTKDGFVILSSEAGVLEIDPANIESKGRLQPGRMFLVDTESGRIIDDEEVKQSIARQKPYRAWVTEFGVSVRELPEPLNVPQPDHATLRQRQQAFGYTIEEIKMVLTPMVVTGEEPISSMGNDTPLAVLSDRPQLLFRYFKQLFAQVTNPPIDPIREYLVMSLVTSIGPKPNLLSESPEVWRRIKAEQPILTNVDLEKIRQLADPAFKSKTLSMLFKASDGPEGLRKGVVDLCRQATRAIREGYKFLILSDRGVSDEWAPIPSLLGVSAVHHHLVRKSIRAEVALIVETGEARDVHHFACLIGFGAGSINPYLAFETLTDMGRENYLPEGIDTETAHSKYIKAINKGLLKIFSKMGISTVQSYCGAQIFEAVGIKDEVIKRYFTGTPSRIEGIGLYEIAQETLLRHKQAYSPTPWRLLDLGGDVHYRVGNEHHNWNPETIANLQHATRTNDPKTFRQFSDMVNDESKTHSTIRGLLDFKFSSSAIPLDEVESAESIVKRFTTGAMSFGALGKEAHETLAIAMNRMGAKSNSGEGGEDPHRFTVMPNGDSKNSAIKQIASARFGVTAHYLVNARELQIKMAQGAKPGEGGQLPGHKVDEAIAKMRYSMPGVQLISPPPHHDIYSIEDLKQLIFDLKNANNKADISVKLVSEVGVGTVAAGVVKAHADKVLISGGDGGTGASPLSSIKYAGIPWELGLAEVHQTLLLNGLRGRVRIETDGQLKTGRDVVVAALLGAEEFGFSTAPLIVEGCIMMRKCHLNTCPVGIATQDPLLRLKFSGQPEHVINYFFFVANEVREWMAKLGFRKLTDMVGRSDRLIAKNAGNHFKAKGIDLSKLLATPGDPGKSAECSGLDASSEALEKRSPMSCVEKQDHGLEGILDEDLIRHCQAAIDHGQRVTGQFQIRNQNRTTGTMLSSMIARKYGAEGLPSGAIALQFTGSAGQSFGAFLSPGITLNLEGEANDYVGKGLSGGRIVVKAPKNVSYNPSETVLIGNTALYGATQGQAFFAGLAGERFAVRNSGALSVVEGTGDHGCEYMTGGVVVVLGKTGKNFAAGMSGGIAFVYDEDGQFASRCNLGMVELETSLGADDFSILRRLIETHCMVTQSKKAKTILDRLDEMKDAKSSGFIKVMPVDYKRALSEWKHSDGKEKALKDKILKDGSAHV